MCSWVHMLIEEPVTSPRPLIRFNKIFKINFLTLLNCFCFIIPTMNNVAFTFTFLTNTCVILCDLNDGSEYVAAFNFV